VVIVRLPPGGVRTLQRFFPKGRSVRRADLPLVAAITTDESDALRTARRIRATGAEVVVSAEPDDPRRTAFCPTHSALVASLSCRRCGTSVCHHCLVRADGDALCDRCAQRARATARSTRTRQLFAVFLFTVFVYHVLSSLHEESRRVSPFGPVPIVVAQFVDHAANPWIVRALNGEPVSGYAGPSLKDLGAWFDAEHRRYTRSSYPYAHVTVRGPWAERVAPPEIRYDGPWWQAGFQSLLYLRYFENLALDHGIDMSAYGVRATVVFTTGDDDDVTAHSRGSEKGRFAVTYVAVDETNPAYALASVAHEISHALGARDLYEPDTMLPSYPEGFVEPFQKPLYPQRFAEIMAVDLPVGRGQEKEIRSLEELRIGYRTAADLGWISDEEADRFYSPPEIAPEDLLEGELLP
jgi:hypothetical protein